MEYTVGVDMGGTNTDIGFVTADGSIVERRSFATAEFTDFGKYVDRLLYEVEQMECARSVADGEAATLAGVGIGAPNANFYTGCVENATNLTMRGILDFDKEINHRRHLPVAISNDANAAAYGEYVYGGAKGMRHFIMFTLGTGVGSGIVIDGRLVHGASGTAGELGHSILFPEGRSCSCGRRGCLEAYCSARGIVQTYCELKGCEPTAEITSRYVGELANASDEVALHAWTVVADQLALGMANAVAFSAPEAIFLMGGPVQVGEPLLRPLREAFERHLLYVYHGTCQIRLSELQSNEAAILGAAALLKMKQ